MNLSLHDAMTYLIWTAIVLMTCLAIWLVVDSNRRFEETREIRQRRLSDRQVRREFRRIVSHLNDGPEWP